MIKIVCMWFALIYEFLIEYFGFQKKVKELLVIVIVMLGYLLFYIWYRRSKSLATKQTKVDQDSLSRLE